MFKKFFKWIKESIYTIINYVRMRIDMTDYASKCATWYMVQNADKYCENGKIFSKVYRLELSVWLTITMTLLVCIFV